MSALVRYLVMKGMREQFIPTLLLAPAALFIMPLLTTGVYNVLRGQGSWPLTLGGKLSPAASAQILMPVVVMFAAIIAATAAFWVFRSEMTSRTIGFFFLARRPMIVPLTAMLFGLGTGIASYLIAAGLLFLLTGSPLSTAGATIVAAPVLMFIGAALGTLLVAISAELSMLIPAYATTVVAAVYLVDHGVAGPAITAMIAVATALTIAAPFLWRRKCAA